MSEKIDGYDEDDYDRFEDPTLKWKGNLKRALERSERDGSPTRRMYFTPTIKEVAKIKAMAKKHKMSISMMLTEAVRLYYNKYVTYSIVLENQDPEHAEFLALKRGFQSAEEWIQHSVVEQIRQLWREDKDGLAETESVF